MAFKPIDGKRDDFRKYLERTGALESISKVFVKLVNCPDRPENAIEFIRANLGDTLQQKDTIEKLKQELEDARSEISQLKRTIDSHHLNVEKMKNLNIGENEELNSSTSSGEDSQHEIITKESVTEVRQDSFAVDEQKDESTENCPEPNEEENVSQNSSTKDEYNNKLEGGAENK